MMSMTKTTQDELRDNGKAAFYTLGGVGLEMMLFGMIIGAGFMMQWALYFLIAAVAVHKAITAGADAIDWTKGAASSAVSKVKFWDEVRTTNDHSPRK